MRLAWFISGYRGALLLCIAGLAVAVGATAAVAWIQSTQRYPRVCARVDDVDMDGLAEVTALAFAKDRVYLLSHDNCITVLAENNGMVSLVEHIGREAQTPTPSGARKLPADKALFGFAGTSLCVTADERFLIVPGGYNFLLFENGPDNALNWASSYGLARYDVEELRRPRFSYGNFVLAPDDRFLVTGSLEVMKFDRDARRFERVFAMEGLPPCRALCMSPDGRHLYCGYSEHILRAFAMDRESGKLTNAQELTSEDCGIHKKKRANSILASPDGSVLAATFVGDKGDVIIFRRDRETGKLEVAQVFSKNKSNIADLDYPVCQTFSPDGQLLYVGCVGSNSIVVFRRDAASDSFSYLETIRDSSLKDPTCIAIHGGLLYVCSREPGTLTVFRIGGDGETDKKPE